MAGLRETKIEEDKTNSMLWQGFNKLLKILIWDENMEIFMECATYTKSKYFSLIQPQGDGSTAT